MPSRCNGVRSAVAHRLVCQVKQGSHGALTLLFLGLKLLSEGRLLVVNQPQAPALCAAVLSHRAAAHPRLPAAAGAHPQVLEGRVEGTAAREGK